MRSLIARLTLAGLVGIVYAGCSSGSTSNLGGTGGSVPSTLQSPSATAPPFTIAPVLVDNGNEFAGAPVPSATPQYVYNEIQSLGPSPASSETQSPLNSTTDPLPSGAPSSAPTNPPEPSSPAGDFGSHLVSFAGSGTQTVVLQFTKTLPNLVYQYNSGIAGQLPGYFTYPVLVMHLSYLPAAPSPGSLISVAAEITGSQSVPNGPPLAFDVRVPCAGLPGTSFTTIACSPVPALNSVSNTTGPNPVIPGASAAFDPVAAFSPKLSIVLIYNGVTDTTSTGNLLGVDNVYVAQQQPGVAPESSRAFRARVR